MNGSQVIINIHPMVGVNPPSLIALESPVHIPEVGKLSSLDVHPQDPLFEQLREGLLEPAVVRDAGNALYGQLIANNAVREALKSALLQPHGVNPIYLHIRSDEAEELPWEALCVSPAPPLSHGFLSLEERWPIARLVTPKKPVADIERFVELPIHVAAVLSALGVPADVEWAALQTALLQPGRDIKMLVLVGNENFKMQLGAVAAKDSRIKVEFIPQFAEDLVDRIAAFAPNIVHIFCHGSTDSGPHLEIANPADWLECADWHKCPVESSIYLQIGALERIDRKLVDTWVITLNCCLGADPIEQASSLARSLVECGFPAAVGMREVISNIDSPVFCQRFYEALFTELDERLAAGNRRFEINWAKLLARPRRVLCEHRAAGPPPRGPEKLKEWTLPVLYVQRMPFRLRRPSSNLGISEHDKRHKQSELTSLKRQYANLATAGASDVALNEIDRSIKELENELYQNGVG